MRIERAIAFAIIKWLFVVVAFYSMCSFAQEPSDTFALRSPAAQVAPGDVNDYRSAVDAIVWTLVNRFGLPAPEGQVEVYATKAAFAEGLVKRLGMTPELARTTAEFAKAGVGNYTLLINDSVMGPVPRPQQIENLAHELTHSLELTLAQQPGLARPQWLIEGFAEWMGYNVADAMGFDRLTDVRTRLVQKVKEAKAKDGLPDLALVHSFPEWVEARRKYGFDATYSQSFLVVDFLVARHSVEKVAEFFRQFRTSSSYVDNFRTAFGEEIAEFGGAFQRHLAGLLAAQN